MAFGSFGTPPASGGLSFGATPASSPFGAQPSLFGASGAPTATPAFGATPQPSLFGAATSSPAFGTPTAAPSLFGAASSAAATTSFSFGGAAPAAAGTTGGFGMFGATSSSTPAPAAGTSLFGTPPAAAQQQQQQQPGSSIFGAIAPFGQQAQQAQQQQQQLAAGMQLSALGYPASEQDELRRRLEAIIAAYTPCSTSYKFQHLFLNVVGNPAQRVRPPQVFDELSWKQALREAGGPDNPDRLWPVAAAGFSDLLARGTAQEAALAENRERLEQLKDAAYKLSRRQAEEMAARVAAARQRHVQLTERLLAVARHADALEGRFASWKGMGRPDSARVRREATLGRALEVLEAQLSPTSPAGLQRRLDALAAACRLRASSAGIMGGGASCDLLSTKLDERSMQQLYSVLQEHIEGLKQLQDVMRSDIKDVEVMRGHRAGASGTASLALVEYM